MANSRKEVEERARTRNPSMNAARRTAAANYDEQYILFKYLREILKVKKAIRNSGEAGKKSIEYQKIVELDIRPRECSNLFYLQRADEVKGFLEALPADYAYLVPKIELYKPSRNSEGEIIDRFVYMPDFTLAKGAYDGALDDPTRFRESLAEFDDADDPVIYSSQLGINCGITSFTFDETQKNMGFSAFKGNLVMNFASMKDFRESKYLELIDPRPDSDIPIDTDVPLASKKETPDKPSKEQILNQQLEAIDAEANNTKFFKAKKGNPRIKMVCGWSVPNTASENVPRNKALYEYVRTSKRTLMLELNQFKTNFQQNGQVSLDFTFHASIESNLKKADSDIFGTGGKIKPRFVSIYLDQLPPQKIQRIAAADKRLEVKKEYDLATKDKVDFFEVTKDSLERDLRRIELLSKSSKDNKRIQEFKKLAGVIRDLQTLEKEISITETRRRFMDKIVGRATRIGGRVNKLFEFAVPGAEVGFSYDRGTPVRPYNFEKIKTSAESRKYSIPFIFLGDILDVAAESGFDKGGTLALGTIPANGFPKNRISIGDLPIALDTFTTWFNDIIGDPDIRVVPFHLFFTRLLEKIVARNTFNLKGLSELGGRIPELSFNMTSVPTAKFKDIFVPGKPVRRSQVLTPDRKSVKTESNQIVESGDRIDLMFITTAEGPQSDSTKGLRGSYEQDLRRGIYHFTVGADRGPLQTITFTEMTNKHFKTEKMVSTTTNSTDIASATVLPQNVNMTLKGNNLLNTGAFIFVDATLGLGRRAAERLRLGGYYRVVTINQTFSPAGWTTDIGCKVELDSLNLANKLRKEEAEALAGSTDGT